MYRGSIGPVASLPPETTIPLILLAVWADRQIIGRTAKPLRRYASRAGTGALLGQMSRAASIRILE
jgi:hypothetical protein